MVANHQRLRAIETEGLLVRRDWIGDKDTMSFTYDLLGGYLIAQYLVATGYQA